MRLSDVVGAHGLIGWDDSVRLLGVDSVTDNSSDVVSSISHKQIGEGLGKGGRTILQERLRESWETGNSDTTEWLAMDSPTQEVGSWRSPQWAVI